MNNDSFRIPELLAPAGNPVIFKYAVDAGADAVYFGGKAFNARAGAGNFDLDEIREAVRYAWPRGVRTHLTLNTLIKNDEWPELRRFAAQVLSCGISALIVTDLGAADFLRECFPDAVLHASTQMNIHDTAGAVFAREHGFSRVVLARELPLCEVKTITGKSGIETEMFVHGALCYAYSGRCLMSSLIGSRSGNRGRCAGTCRLPYRTQGSTSPEYIMNLKDLCGIGALKEIAETGVSSLKIEGRLKSAPYVAGITAAYRHALDELARTGRNPVLSEEEMEELLLLFNRGGFSKGYLFDQKKSAREPMICRESPKHSGITAGTVDAADGRKMTLSLDHAVLPGDTLEIATVRQPFPSLIVQSRELKQGRLRTQRAPGVRGGEKVRLLVSRKLNEEVLDRVAEKKIPISLKAVFIKNHPAEIRIGFEKEGRVETIPVVSEIIPEEAKNRALTEEEVIRQLSRDGASSFLIRKVEVSMDPDLFLPISQLNALRRAAFAKAEAAFSDGPRLPEYRRPASETVHFEAPDPQKEIAVMISNADQLEAAAKADHVFLHEDAFEPDQMAVYRSRLGGKLPGIVLPPISREKVREKLQKRLQAWKKAGIREAVASHPGQIGLLKALGLKVWCGAGISIMSDQSAEVLLREADGITLSVELSLREVREFKPNKQAALYVYGHVPVMITEQCPVREEGFCGKKRETVLTDRMGENWRVETHCRDCYALIYSSAPIVLGTRGLKEINTLPVSRLWMNFTTEGPEETARQIERIARAGEGQIDEKEEYASYWFRRGVE